MGGINMASEWWCDVCGEAPGTEERCTGGDTSMMLCEACAAKGDREAAVMRAAAKADLAEVLGELADRRARSVERCLLGEVPMADIPSRPPDIADWEAAKLFLIAKGLLQADMESEAVRAMVAASGLSPADMGGGDVVAEVAAVSVRRFGRPISMAEAAEEPPGALLEAVGREIAAEMDAAVTEAAAAMVAETAERRRRRRGRG
jgi:hypothetical protein